MTAPEMIYITERVAETAHYRKLAQGKIFVPPCSTKVRIAYIRADIANTQIKRLVDMLEEISDSVGDLMRDENGESMGEAINTMLSEIRGEK